MASSNAIYDLLGKHARPKSKHSPHENQNHNVGIQRYDPFLATVSQKSGNHNVGTRFKIEYNILFLAASNVTISTFAPHLPRKTSMTLRIQRYDFGVCPTPATKTRTRGSPNAAPATKTGTRGSPNTAPATKNGIRDLPNTALTTKSGTGDSPNTAPATRNAFKGLPNTAPTTKTGTRGSPNTAPATKSGIRGLPTLIVWVPDAVHIKKIGQWQRIKSIKRCLVPLSCHLTTTLHVECSKEKRDAACKASAPRAENLPYGSHRAFMTCIIDCLFWFHTMFPSKCDGSMAASNLST